MSATDSRLEMKKRNKFFRMTDAKAFYILIAPFIAMFLFIRVFPFVWGMYMSMTNFSGFNQPSFVGFENYMNLFRLITESGTRENIALMSTLAIAAVQVPLTMFVGLGLALLLNQNIKGDGFFRTVYYIPSIIPGVVAVLMWRILLNQNGGLINIIIDFFRYTGYDHVPINWFDFDNIRSALYFILAWTAGAGVLTYLAALKNVPLELYESAAIDGAGAWRRFYRITLPMLTPVIFFNLINAFIAGFQIFGQPVMLAGFGGGVLTGQPDRPIYTYVVHIFQEIFVRRRFGYGLAMTWVLFFGSIIVTRVIFWSSKFWVFYETDTSGGKKKKKRKRKEKNEEGAVLNGR